MDSKASNASNCCVCVYHSTATTTTTTCHSFIIHEFSLVSSQQQATESPQGRSAKVRWKCGCLGHTHLVLVDKYIQ